MPFTKNWHTSFSFFRPSPSSAGASSRRCPTSIALSVARPLCLWVPSRVPPSPVSSPGMGNEDSPSFGFDRPVVPPVQLRSMSGSCLICSPPPCFCSSFRSRVSPLSPVGLRSVILIVPVVSDVSGVSLPLLFSSFSSLVGFSLFL